MKDVESWKLGKLDELTKLKNSISFLDFGRILETGNSMVETLKNGTKWAK